MKKFILLTLLIVGMVGIVSAIPATEVSYFYSVTCSHCKNVADSGVLESVAEIEGVFVDKFEVSGPVAREKYLEYIDKFDIKNGGIPFVVIEQDGEFFYLMGDVSIIEDLNDSIVNFSPYVSGSDNGELVSWIIFGVVLVVFFVLLLILSRRK